MRHCFLRNSIVILLILFLTLLFSSIESTAQIKLGWAPNPEPNVAGYRLYYGTASGAYARRIDVGNVTTYMAHGLSYGVTYYFALTAYDQSGESGYSNEVSGMVVETVSTPNVLSGVTNGITKKSYSYTTGGSTSSLGNRVQYQFEWNGNGITKLSAWGAATRGKRWPAAGTYNVRARARSTAHKNVVSNWSGSLSVTISAPAPNP
jgi:hypothetical protein